MHDLLFLAALAVVGCAAGFVNTVAGAGSLLSLRALMLFGISPSMANGTNRVPVLAQSLTAAAAFAREGRVARALVVWSAAPACVGALAGSLAASFIPDRALKPLLIGVLLLVGVLGLRKAARVEHPAGEGLDEAAAGAVRLACVKRPVVQLLLFFAGLYGGFLQAGVGLLLLYALGQVAGLDLVRANALKVVTVAIFSVVAAGVFIARGQVVWLPALAMSAGSMLGALLGVRYAIGWAQQLKVWVVVIDLVACAILIGQELL